MLLFFLSSLFFVSVTSDAITGMRPVGTGLSQGKITNQEQTLFVHDEPGVMTHFWAAGSPVVDNVTMRYYVDNETEASIEFVASFASGVGFDDQEAPWGTKWMGKGAKTTGWFHNFRVPFDSIRITYQLVNQTVPDSHTVWLIVRGMEGMKSFQIGDVVVPQTARMKLIKTETNLEPLEFVDLINLKSGTRGMLFQSTLQIESSQNFNFMEGCFHFYGTFLSLSLSLSPLFTQKKHNNPYTQTTSTRHFLECFSQRVWRITTTLRFTLMEETFMLL